MDFGGSSCPVAGFRLAVGSGQDPAQRRSAAQVRGRAAVEPRTGVVIDLVKAAAPPTWLVSGRLAHTDAAVGEFVDQVEGVSDGAAEPV